MSEETVPESVVGECLLSRLRDRDTRSYAGALKSISMRVL
jgi:hypothetical protein